jgi:large subunit ribosomal protein L25
MTKIILNLEPRTVTGRKVKSLRRLGTIPLNIYGKKTKSISAQIKLQEFNKLFDKAGETNLVYITVGTEKEERPCLISHVQLNPVTDIVIHADFHQVDLTEKATAEIPVELIGESPAVSAENATIVTQVNHIEVEALPSDFPEKFVIDISKLAKVGDSFKVSDLKYDSKKIQIDLDPETVIVAAQAQQAEEVIEAPAAEVVAPTEETKDETDKTETKTEPKTDAKETPAA